MKIGIDITTSKSDQGGTGTYVNNLYKSINLVKSREILYEGFVSDDLGSSVRNKKIISKIVTLYRDIIWNFLILPVYVLIKKIDVLHMPANIAPWYMPCPLILTIFDTAIFKEDAKFTTWFYHYAKFVIPRAAKRADYIITISEYSKKEIIKYLGVDPNKIVVTYLSAGEAFQLQDKEIVRSVINKYDLGDYILSVGTLVPRKNVITSLRAFYEIKQQGYDGHFVHVGSFGWMYDDVMNEVEKLGIQEFVHFLGHISESELVCLYNGARLMVYPSLYEGFGIPPLEAMSCGCPVITSNVTSIPEVVGQAALLVEPQNVQEIVEAMRRILYDEEFASNLSKAGLERATQFSWEQCASETLKVYEAAARM
jgi:glycosyltransferase involved in cell wall biosynthesis